MQTVALMGGKYWNLLKMIFILELYDKVASMGLLEENCFCVIRVEIESCGKFSKYLLNALSWAQNQMTVLKNAWQELRCFHVVGSLRDNDQYYTERCTAFENNRKNNLFPLVCPIDLWRGKCNMFSVFLSCKLWHFETKWKWNEYQHFFCAYFCLFS